jgi:hypothetical protein
MPQCNLRKFCQKSIYFVGGGGGEVPHWQLKHVVAPGLIIVPVSTGLYILSQFWLISTSHNVLFSMICMYSELSKFVFTHSPGFHWSVHIFLNSTGLYCSYCPCFHWSAMYTLSRFPLFARRGPALNYANTSGSDTGSPPPPHRHPPPAYTSLRVTDATKSSVVTRKHARLQATALYLYQLYFK